MAKCYASTDEGKQVVVSFPSLYKGSLILPRPTTAATTTTTTTTPRPLLRSGSPSCSSASSSSSSVAAARASKIHSEAERRRRERINSHLSTLRCMIPDAHKMDKASLLSKVVDQVKDLKRKANDTSKTVNVPPEIDEVTVERHKGGRDHTFSGDETLRMRVSVTCDDRPDLFASLIQAFHKLRLRTIRADITCIGGRVQNVFILCGTGEGSENMCLGSLKECLKEALAKAASPEVLLSSSSSSSSSSSFSSKRQRLLGSH
ncbi:transcription factor bHLH30-like [Ananas comosus]|uniref:Transcription factor bHLH30-like n=2 Tax=Ananas comosus TaxID=4615 RepID=A0A6P5G2K5_ANACO|nr:transcription factor bHLH30-like [Ananas comosus]CAD1839844.1 unnamed protein product [Ananas comosus var. bracteatus]